MEPPSGVALTMVMVCLTVVTGVLDAVSFLALGHVFTATQTGNLLFLGFGIAGQGGLPVAATVVSLGAFLVGAALGARVESGLSDRRRPWFPVALLAEAALLVAAAVAGWESGPGDLATGRRYAAIGLMAAAMGMRNVTAMRVAAPDLTTTVETRAMTALVSGSPLGRDRRLGYGSGAGPRRLSSVGAMLAGGLLGAWLLGLGTRPPLVVLLVALTVAATALLVPGLAHRRSADG
ncbi:membrane protein [Streptomyces albospinus]|uniref:Membrane protein n=1 Tax=Streptomyces albospinus TaxID=285515 RepID=A0ABQ2VLM7_9ACTN|nr:YoaK family protein [Streptomyces albospinus]GGU95039.1 membrane protein [Streptomyces albospinus]